MYGVRDDGLDGGWQNGGHHGASSELERFLSAIAFCYAQPVESVAHGSRFGDDPYLEPMTRPLGTRAGTVLVEPCKSVGMRAEPEVALALAHYCEGMNASSPFYRLLALWNSVDAVFRDETVRDAFLDGAST